MNPPRRLSEDERVAFEDRWMALESQGIQPAHAFSMLEASHPRTAALYMADRVDEVTEAILARYGSDDGDDARADRDPGDPG